MRGIERKTAIMEQLRQKERVDVTELAALFNVSTMTIRRDLAKLAKDGLVIQEYGGATLKRTGLFEYPIPMKQTVYRNEKYRIAKQCEHYIQEGDSIFLDAGTTVAELAKLLAERPKRITVMSHSLLVANILATVPEIELILCPGHFRIKSIACMGQLTDNFLASFHIDKLFLGVEGVASNFGLSVPHIADGATKQTLLRRSDWIACMADSSKFGHNFYYKICDLSQVDILVTDTNISEYAICPYEEKTKIIRV